MNSPIIKNDQEQSTSGSTRPSTAEYDRALQNLRDRDAGLQNGNKGGSLDDGASPIRRRIIEISYPGNESRAEQFSAILGSSQQQDKKPSESEKAKAIKL